jgi:hypothetical protein
MTSYSQPASPGSDDSPTVLTDGSAHRGMYQVDVLICTERVKREGQLIPTHRATDFRRYALLARDGVEADLIACQMAYVIHGDAVGSVVVDWPDKPA